MERLRGNRHVKKGLIWKGIEEESSHRGRKFIRKAGLGLGICGRWPVALRLHADRLKPDSGEIVSRLHPDGTAG
ncbi:MAG: hypothetical protein MZV63_53190 [Marinilabiliales bacterium]|nr:hypothetical protein [Marinilabiliales bacterium]